MRRTTGGSGAGRRRDPRSGCGSVFTPPFSWLAFIMLTHLAASSGLLAKCVYSVFSRY